MTPQRFFAATATTTATTVATVPAGERWLLKELILTNYTATARTVTVTVAGVTIVGAKSVGANDLIILALSTVLEAGDVIQISASAATAINVVASGVTTPA